MHLFKSALRLFTVSDSPGRTSAGSMVWGRLCTAVAGAAMTLKSGGTFPLHHRFCSESPNCFTSALRTLIEKTFWIVLDSQGG